MDSGIYLIECNGERYVGQSVNIEQRWKQHVTDLKCNRHPNKHMQILWYSNKKDFEFSVLEYCYTYELNEKEKYWIKALNTLSPNGLNIGGGGSHIKCFRYKYPTVENLKKYEKKSRPRETLKSRRKIKRKSK